MKKAKLAPRYVWIKEQLSQALKKDKQKSKKGNWQLQGKKGYSRFYEPGVAIENDYLLTFNRGNPIVINREKRQLKNWILHKDKEIKVVRFDAPDPRFQNENYPNKTVIEHISGSWIMPINMNKPSLISHGEFVEKGDSKKFNIRLVTPALAAKKGRIKQGHVGISNQDVKIIKNSLFGKFGLEFHESIDITRGINYKTTRPITSAVQPKKTDKLSKYNRKMLRIFRKYFDSVHWDENTGTLVLHEKSDQIDKRNPEHMVFTFPNGKQLYRKNNVLQPAHWVLNPETVTPEEVVASDNMEVRRIGIDIIGVAAFLKAGNLVEMHRIGDEHQLVGLRGAVLYRDPASQKWENEITVLEVINSTAEPDGSFKKYYFNIDPEAYDDRAATDCLAAIASTWRKRSDPAELFFETPEDYLALARES